MQSRLTGALLLAGFFAPGAGWADSRSQADLSAWRPRHEQEIRVLEKALANAKVDKDWPLHQLLRSASDWQKCDADPFSVPPVEQHATVVETLILLRQLRANGALAADSEIVSAHRPAEIASCASSTESSSHSKRFAVDILGSDSTAAGLCTFWRANGKAFKMGLSKYPSGRIHIDVTGYRSWGGDCTCETSFCNPCAKSMAPKCVQSSR